MAVVDSCFLALIFAHIFFAFDRAIRERSSFGIPSHRAFPPLLEKSVILFFFFFLIMVSDAGLVEVFDDALE